MAKSVYTKRNIKYRNYLINGDMNIAQRGTSFPAIASAAYSLDRFKYSNSSAAVHTAAQNSDVPTFSQSSYLFQNSMLLTLTTVDASIAAGDQVNVQQAVEGFNFINLAQKVFTLSFWVKATLPGTYCVSFRNSGLDRSYVAEYTINATDTWEYKTITVSASPAAGTWTYGTGSGLIVSWQLACGSTFQTTAGAWQTGNFLGTSNQVNGVNTLLTATNFRLTGVMLNEGPEALPFRLFDDSGTSDLVPCQRYYEKTYDLDVAPGTNPGGGAGREGISITNLVQTNWDFKVKKRSTPSMVAYSSNSGASGVWTTNVQTPTASFSTIGTTGVSIRGTGTITAGNVFNVHATAEAEL